MQNLRPCAMCGQHPQHVRVVGSNGGRDYYMLRCPCGRWGAGYTLKAAMEWWNEWRGQQEAPAGVAGASIQLSSVGANAGDTRLG